MSSAKPTASASTRSTWTSVGLQLPVHVQLDDADAQGLSGQRVRRAVPGALVASDAVPSDGRVLLRAVVLARGSLRHGDRRRPQGVTRSKPSSGFFYFVSLDQNPLGRVCFDVYAHLAFYWPRSEVGGDRALLPE